MELLAFMLFFYVRIHIAGGDATEELDVFVRVKLCHFAFCCRFSTLREVNFGSSDRPCIRRCTHEYLHFLVQTIVHDQGMTHSYTSWFHPVGR